MLKDKPSRHFTWKELQCKGCKRDYCITPMSPMCNVSPRSIKRLQALRNLVNKPLTILSAARCPEHNEAVGGKINSFHLSTAERESQAFDIKWPKGVPRDEFVRMAQSLGFTGVGLYSTFIHVDDRMHPVVWDTGGRVDN